MITQVVELANLLNCIVVRKGPVDIITDGKEAILVSQPGSLKRCGGIGDILSGVVGTFLQY
jgi:ATP-dependent NAD(P)H-hydrate dehydratase